MRATLLPSLTLMLVLASIASCQIADLGNHEGESPTGALCAKNEDCASNFCRSDGICGQLGCSTKKPCPAHWTCETSRGDPIFGLGGGGTFCEPSCDACPSGTSCENGTSCAPLVPKVTLSGDVPPHVGQPSNIDLVIDTRGRSFTSTKWSFDGVAPTPSTGSGTKVSTTFHELGAHELVVTFSTARALDSIAKVPIAVCGEAGATCSGGKDECCGGECALERYDVGGVSRQSQCVSRCPATCAPGWSCREFDRVQNSSAPTGQFCLPDLARITLDYTPKNPTTEQAVTVTATVTSPAGLKIMGYDWSVDDVTAFKHDPTYTATFDTSGTHKVTLTVQDDAVQFSKQSIEVKSCIPAGQTCGFLMGSTCCGASTCIGSTCQ